MKKIAAIILIGMLLLMTSGCGGQTASESAGTGEKKESTGDVESSEEQKEITQTPVTAVIESDRLIRFEPEFTALDDDNVKIEIFSLEKVIVNEGSENYEYNEYRVNYAVTNKSDSEDVNVYIPQSAASIGAYTVQFSQNVIETKAGKINDTCYFSCISNPNGWSSEGSEHIQSVKDLLDFEADIKVGYLKDSVVQESYDVNVSFTGFEVRDLQSEAEAEQAALKEKYKKVYDALYAQVWYFNGGSETSLNRISFSDSGAEIGQVYFDGNGKHEKESIFCDTN